MATEIRKIMSIVRAQNMSCASPIVNVLPAHLNAVPSERFRESRTESLPVGMQNLLIVIRNLIRYTG
jgi:hypothetical protein